MAVINTNAKALFSQAALKQTDRGMTIAMQQLSTGKRINSARDDAAGLSIVTRMTEQIRGLNQAVRNANDAINLIQTAEGATNEITDMMQRMRELAVQAVNDTNSNADRSYLDLEFQQLKQQIVQISDNTEWNGFSVLNGTAGQRVGEMPLYKVTSVNQFGSVFIQPTTSKTITGTDAGEVQQVALTGTPAVGVINIAGVDVNITSSESTLSAAGSKIATTLNNSDSFVKQGITASYSAGTLTLNYSAALGDVPLASVSVGSTGLTATATTTRLAATQASETFANNGKFLQSGAIQFDIASGAAAGSAVTATFTNPDNKKILMTGTLSTVNPAVVNFNVADGLNSQVITDNLSYGLLASDGSALNLTATPRALSMTVGVQGSIPTLRDGDLLINGVNVGPSLAADDILSPRNNAAGSAIAKAAAINRVAVDQGISQGEIQSLVFSGTPMPGTITVGGVNVALTSNDNTPELAAAKIAAALQASPQFNSSTGRLISYAPGSPTINISYPVSEGNVANIAVESGATGLGSVVNTTQPYATKTAGTGVFAKVNENVFSGQAMTGGPVATGVVFINGYASADISTVYNNAQATRDNVVRAINLISDKTGVKAIDTGSDDKGIQLLAVDGRNIEVRFQTSGSTNNISFGQRIGMREGVQSSTISLESKVDAPVVLTGSASGDITRAGLVTGNYTKNEAVLNTKSRAPVDASAAQVSSVTIAGTGISTGKSITTVVNGTSFTVNYAAAAVPADNVNHTVTITSNTPQAIRDAMASLINATATLGVYATAGSSNGELQLTARTPGVAFTMTASTTETSAAAATVATAQITANQVASTKSLSSNDLVINGVNVRPATAADDKFSNTVVSSSDPAASAIALAAAINDSTSLTGVKAYANPAQIAGTLTTTATPVSGKQSLWVNGTEIQVNFVQNESATDRRAKVVTAINERTGQHGVTASDNGQGVTLITKDGRNLSVWFDSSQKDLDASDFGLDKGGSVAQISKIAISGVSTGDVSVMINGVTVSTTSLTASSTAAVTAAALRDAINANTSLKNVTASLDSSNNVIITSNVPGSAFDLRAPTVAATSAQTLTLSTVSANSRGNNDVSAVDLSTNYKTNVLGSANAPLSAMNIRTVYGTVRLVASAPILPTAPGADGLTPSSMNADGRPILIQAGTDGFGSMSNFSALGFNEGTFGGRASEDMAPPKVGRLAFQVGSGANQVVTIDLADFGKKGAITGAITGDVDLNVDQRSVRINTREGATAVLNLLDTAMDKVNATRATMGAVMNRLDHVVNNLTNVSMNMSASRSQIQDSDYAQASTDLAKSQIMQQAATAVLAQANTSQQSVLKLLGG